MVHSEEKPHHCSVCDKGFRQKGSLKEHLLTHSGDKPHKCSMCDAAFTQKGHLKAHT